MTQTIFVGTYTKLDDSGDSHRSEGIYVFRLEPESGRLEQVAAVEGGPDPSFLDVHPSGRHLYAVNELGGGQATSFAIDPDTARPVMLNSESTGGEHPCYVSFDPSGRWLLAANYTGGSVCSLPIEADGRLGRRVSFDQHVGHLGPNKGRQDRPHAHCILPDPSGRFILSADLGQDRVWVYKLEVTTGQLTPNDPPGYDGIPGAGPRHLAFHPNGRFIYIANELDSTVTACEWDDQAGVIRAMQTEPLLPAGFTGENTAADIHFTPDGRFLYVSNRGHDSLACFAVFTHTGRLEFAHHTPCGGKVPRNFAIDPTGRCLLVANQGSDNIVPFRVNENGALERIGAEVSVPKPVCIKIVEEG